jgi:hypothetical protein
MKDLIRDEDEAYERLLAKIYKVFRREIESRAYNNTQKNILDVMIAQSVESSGGPDNVTIDQLIGMEFMALLPHFVPSALTCAKHSKEGS